MSLWLKGFGQTQTVPLQWQGALWKGTFQGKGQPHTSRAAVAAWLEPRAGIFCSDHTMRDTLAATAWIFHRVCSSTSFLGNLAQQQLGHAGSWSGTACPCARVRPPHTRSQLSRAVIFTTCSLQELFHMSLSLWHTDRTVSIISSVFSASLTCLNAASELSALCRLNTEPFPSTAYLDHGSLHGTVREAWPVHHPCSQVSHALHHVGFHSHQTKLFLPDNNISNHTEIQMQKSTVNP